MGAAPEGAMQGWHLDKRVPIAIILAIVMQSVGLIIWAVRLDARVTTLEADKIVLAADRAADRAAGIDRSQRIIRLETRYDGIRDTLVSISQKRDRLIEQRRAEPFTPGGN